MNMFSSRRSDRRTNAIFHGIAALWSILIIVLAGWNYWESYSSTLEIARSAASESFSKDLVYRRWATQHGGLYAPITPETPPNPYLSDIPERDISTPSGKRLTLINPAYMTRQVHELARKAYGLQGHITSLRPIRPENAPDDWESKALQGFERGLKEVSSLEPLEGETYLRLMRPLITEAGCLNCHATQGYKIDDIRGGISVSLPWSPFRKALQSQLRVIILAHLGIWAIGVLGLYLGRNRLQKFLSAHRQVEETLRESEKKYRELSIIDDLTQLYNSRHFYHQLKTEIDRSERYEQPLTLLLLDLDDLKKYNDAYGHIEGDRVLQRLGLVVRRCLRQTDSAYRYGGEEFTILLPMTTSSDAAVTAERIRTEFKKETFSPTPDREIHVTVSIGLAQHRPQEEMKVFVHRVDQLMYQGKKEGKDRVCSDPAVKIPLT
ncbi:MAG: diguanylate cyclase [Deltaproteobacteria bacterium]|nr:diguanylate cyclase [Deltaproteobacteria bacterium]